VRLAALFALAALLACTPETDAPADPSAAAAGDGLATREEPRSSHLRGVAKPGAPRSPAHVRYAPATGG